ncbi:nucleoside deaminase [Phycicoccus flavus]|uniref:nucleoside deaminase n=1 Tax=Phycicoccus flavus TaxID=2502783 RepID=UPI000FEBC83A|nr:nucleoside deaminase [Phycicoccus flavus]NHA69844.1 nucleoside deaminase [Phycicoccus flavus]
MTTDPSGLTDEDLRHLARCVALAEEALDAGDQPFGSVLVDASGRVLLEERNREGGGDATRHPELALVQWAARHLAPQDRASATVYTSGEHCPMCAAAHAWVGLGRIVFATSAGQTSRWSAERGAAPSPVLPLPVAEVAPGVPTVGPVPRFAEAMRALHLRRPDGEA